jgi:peptidyl-prolyl cis-trans isomerase C
MDLEVPVATIDGGPRTRREFCEFLYRDLATPQLLELFINRHLIITEARRRGIEVNDVDVAVWVEEQLVDHVRQAGSAEAFERKLAEGGFTKDAWATRLRYQARPMLYLRRLAVAERTTPEGREAFEARIREEYHEAYGERVTGSHIFVEVAPDAAGVDHEAALAKARAAAEQVRRGIPFADVARRLSEDAQTRPLGGTLGTFGKDRFARSPEFNAAFFSLEPGRVSDPIRSPAGYHVILVEKRTPAARPFDDAVRQELAGRLSNEPPTDAELEGLIQRLRSRALIARSLTFDD